MSIKPGQEYPITVTKLKERGIIVQIDGTPDTEFIHISKLSTKFVSNIASLVAVGDKLIAIAIEGKDKTELSLQHLHLESLNKTERHKKSSNKTNDATSTKPSLDDMIAAAERDLKEKQLLTASKFGNRQKFGNRRRSVRRKG